jgi:hypothetical protein
MSENRYKDIRIRIHGLRLLRGLKLELKLKIDNVRQGKFLPGQQLLHAD